MKRVLKVLWSLPGVLALAALGLYALAGFVLVPWWLQRELPQLLKTELNASATVGAIRLNPFNLTVEVRDFALTEAGGVQPALAFERLWVDFESSSLLRRVWTFAEITIERPRFNLALDASGALNLAKLAPIKPSDQAEARPKDNTDELPRLLLQKLVLKQGHASFTDASFAQAASTWLEPVEFELHDLATLPDHRGDYALSARAPEGGTLSWRGTLSLAPMASEGQIELKNLKLATLWQFVQDKFRIEEPGGSAELSLQYHARYAQRKIEASASAMALKVSDITVRQKGQAQAALSAREAALTGGTFNLLERQLQFAELALRQAVVNTVIDADGTVNWAQLAAPAAQPSRAAKPVTPPATEHSPDAPWQVAIDKVDISEVRLSVLDQAFVRPLQADIAHASLRASLKATLGTQLRGHVEGIALALAGVRVAEADAQEALMTLAGASLSGGSFDFSSQKFSADGVKISQPVAHMVRDADGLINLARAFQTRQIKPSEPSTLSAEIRAFEVNDGALTFQDRGMAPPLTLDLQAIQIRAQNLSTQAKSVIPIEASLQIKQGGALSLAGSVAPEQQTLTLKLEARQVALVPLDGWLAKHTTLKLRAGSADASGQLDWRGLGNTPGLRFVGQAGLNNVRLDQTPSGERLIGWKGLLAEGIEIDSGKRMARIENLRLFAPQGKIAIAKDRSTNLSGIMRTRPAPTSTPRTGEARAQDQAPAAPAAGAAPFIMNVERMHVGSGELDFSDQSLLLPFSALIRGFTGAMSGLSTEPGTRAVLKLEGRVDEFGQAKIDGTINPFEPKAFTDVLVSFRNIEMSSLSPYSATFAGRRITSGKLTLDLQYKLINSQLLGENKVSLDQFTLGDRFESPSALDLPLDLAIALLTDANGKIDLTVPVRGNVDNPEFTYGHLIGQALRTALVNIVSAPFRALAALFGARTEKIDAIGFEAGHTLLAPPEREKLNNIARVLQQRPQLRLVIEGRYDPRQDGAALRTVAARRSLAERLGIKPVMADDPAPLNFDNGTTQRNIEQLLEERAGKDSVAKFTADYEKASGQPAKRVNLVLALVGRGSPDRDFYEAMFMRVAEHQALANTELLGLGQQRSNAILSYLVGIGGLDASRVAAKPVAMADADQPGMIQSTLILDLSK